MIPVCIDRRNYNFPSGQTYNEGHSRGFNELDESTKRTINDIIDFAVEKIYEINKKFVKKNEEDKIYSEDVVIISIDNNEPVRYYLTSFSWNKDALVHFPQDWHQTYEPEEMLKCTTSLGEAIIGRYVGETVNYTDDEGKNEHSIKILDHRRSKCSYPLSKYEIEAIKERPKSR